ncbi:MAG: TVP38/TMEM64 family protein [Desulfarculaceae bacterium]|nr:TVP38/TMEM64 family protein [Desulfarculaceae bacterium]MCF8072862.1 TVP38/TMEM64 family protein [Desulfarculaceae bacterium]MCF8101030.1 TVP38/TMEM64 family protein [Desulfarculaceae bacterium]MCF8115583.1 TVP38/TMEM64 family protein [Desulfarculaceae bacterium]
MHRGLIKKLVIVGLILAAVLAFWLLDLGQYFSLSYVKQSRDSFQAYYQTHPGLTLGGYFVVYVLVTAFSLPGAAVMTLLGGALFGFWWTLLVVSFASTIGATLACFFARFVLGNWVQARFGDKLEPINRGVEREGAFYLFTLRLVPLFPFFVINLVMGLTKMPLWTFYWVSQLGMLPGTAVFTNAGKELGQIDSLGGILSPGLIISFVILGLFPLVVKKGLSWYRRRTGRKEIIE